MFCFHHCKFSLTKVRELYSQKQVIFLYGLFMSNQNIDISVRFCMVFGGRVVNVLGVKCGWWKDPYYL